MSADLIYPVGVILFGIIAGVLVFVAFSKVSARVINFFQLYPESKEVLPLSLRLISWCVGGIVFLLFLRFALQTWQLNFTLLVVEELILAAPKYIIAILLVIAGFYVSRMIKEKAVTYPFKQKNRVLLVMDFIIHMTFFFTALALIGIDMSFFLIFYTFVLAVIGFIVALTVGLAIGIPFGLGLYSRLYKNGNASKKKKSYKKV